MAFILYLSLRQIVEAQQLVVTGLSLAASDFALRWLIGQAMVLRDEPLRLTVVNRAP